MAQLRLDPVTISLLHLPLGGLSAASTNMKRSAQLVPRQSASRHPPTLLASSGGREVINCIHSTIVLSTVYPLSLPYTIYQYIIYHISFGHDRRPNVYSILREVWGTVSPPNGRTAALSPRHGASHVNGSISERTDMGFPM